MAVNVRLIGGYHSENGTATASSTATGYDAANVVPLDRPTKWKSNVTTASWIEIDCGSAVAVTGACIANHNGGGWSGAEVQYYDGATWQTALALSGLSSTADHYATFSVQTRQRWRIYTSGATAAMEVGVFYLGTATTLSKNPSYGSTEGDVFNVESARATSGAIVSEKYGRRIARFELPFDRENSTLKGEIRDFIREEDGPLRPFFYVPADESGSSVQGVAYMVRMDSLSLVHTRLFNNVYQTKLVLLEEV